MIGIVDYGVGNLLSLKSSLKFLGVEHTVSADKEELARCDRLILPGVGAFGDARAILKEGGITRYADMILPMDETLMMCAVDISGRAYLVYEVVTYTDKVGQFDCELVKEFLLAFVRNAEITLHFKMLAGENSHHILEAVFKALARVLRKATDVDERLKGAIPSSKGAL